MESTFKPKIKINWTKTRSAIYNLLKETKSPLDAFDVLEHLHFKKMTTNKVTVYRILELFEEAEVVQKIEFGEGKSRYEIKREDHHHLICRTCSRVQDFEDNYISQLEKDILKSKKFKVDYHSLEFFGTCKNCQ